MAFSSGFRVPNPVHLNVPDFELALAVVQIVVQFVRVRLQFGGHVVPVTEVSEGVAVAVAVRGEAEGEGEAAQVVFIVANFVLSGDVVEFADLALFLIEFEDERLASILLQCTRILPRDRCVPAKYAIFCRADYTNRRPLPIA